MTTNFDYWTLQEDATKMPLDKFIEKYRDEYIAKNTNYFAIQQTLKGIWQQARIKEFGYYEEE
jgi:hypothetical protein|tara:strand:- start:351 stop:539 length:189 start_codon:yes stop_codon:yes gene_type:complete